MLSVRQFVSHLDLASQRDLLGSQETFLSFLREQYRRTEKIRLDLENAARERVAGEYVQINAAPEEREAAKAVRYAIQQLANRLETTQPRSSSHLRTNNAHPISSNERHDKRWRTGYGGAGGWVTSEDFYPRVPFVVTFTANERETARLNVRTDRLETTLSEVKRGYGWSRRYVAAVASGIAREEVIVWRISHPAVERLALRMMLEARCLARRCPRLNTPAVLDEPYSFTPPREQSLPFVEVHPETLELGRRCISTPRVARRDTPEL
ncbi:MAG: hypothetical protein HC933_09570 [Pleurocapsa sp. SU_196_0]|nr:hypothetical protein [Pleurocapsa sp. SU_196_0]